MAQSNQNQKSSPSPLDNEEATLADGQTERLANDDTATKEVIIDNEQDLQL
jgi:hypothetical protein